MNGDAPPRHVWLCADDYGLSPGVNRAIRDLIERGRLNATSAMVVGPALGRGEVNALNDAAADFANMKNQPADNPDEKLDPMKIAMGKAMFLACAACHGREAVGAGGPAPDLRESGVPLDPQAFQQVVLGGALKEQGMPPITYFNADQVEAIRQYVRSRARAAAAVQ